MQALSIYYFFYIKILILFIFLFKLKKSMKTKSLLFLISLFLGLYVNSYSQSLAFQQTNQNNIILKNSLESPIIYTDMVVPSAYQRKGYPQVYIIFFSVVTDKKLFEKEGFPDKAQV